MLVIRHEAGTGISCEFTAAAEEGHAVAVSGAKTVAPAAVGEMSVGTAINKVDINEVATFRTKGDIVPMIADAAITAGAIIVPGATAGQVKVRDGAAPEAAEFIIGIAWTAAAAAGDEVLVIRT